MTNSTVVVNVHNTSTEVLIIISQTVFFVLLFLLLKNGLVDRRGMLSSKERINDEMFQIMAIFFAIFVIIGLFMIPIESYEYANFVVPITYFIMIIIVTWELYVVFGKDKGTSSTTGTRVSKTVRFNLTPDIETGVASKKTDLHTSSNQDGPSASKFWSGPNRSSIKSAFSFRGLSSTGTGGTTKRPVNF